MHWWGCVLLSLKVHLDNNKALGPEEMLRWCQMRIGVLVMKWKRCSMISGKNTRIMDDVRGFMIWIQHRISNCQRYFRDGLYDMLWFANVECHENLDFGLRILCMWCNSSHECLVRIGCKFKITIDDLLRTQ